MNVSFGSTAFGKKASNRGSCTKLANYLEKENIEKSDTEKRLFFSHSEDKVSVDKVIQQIDNNKRKLGKNDSKYFLLNVSPSQKELAIIPKQKLEQVLKDYTRNLMDAYAENFNKGLKGKDLMYFAKIEEQRVDKKSGIPKPGNNFHIHVIISRRDIEQRFKLSPETNHINSKQGVIRGGFNRNDFRKQSEILFDQMTGYNRRNEDTFDFQNSRKKREKIEKRNLSKTKKPQENNLNSLSIQTTEEKQVPKNEEVKKPDLSILFQIPEIQTHFEYETEEYLKKRRKKIGFER